MQLLDFAIVSHPLLLFFDLSLLKRRWLPLKLSMKTHYFFLWSPPLRFQKDLELALSVSGHHLDKILTASFIVCVVN